MRQKPTPAEPKARISVARNPRASHDYHLLETWETGIVLTGTEVKSLRNKKASIKESYAHVRNGELWLEGMHITPYEQGNRWNPDPVRSRKLLMHRREIERLIGGVQQTAGAPRWRWPSARERRPMIAVKTSSAGSPTARCGAR